MEPGRAGAPDSTQDGARSPLWERTPRTSLDTVTAPASTHNLQLYPTATGGNSRPTSQYATPQFSTPQASLPGIDSAHHVPPQRTPRVSLGLDDDISELLQHDFGSAALGDVGAPALTAEQQLVRLQEQMRGLAGAMFKSHKIQVQYGRTNHSLLQQVVSSVGARGADEAGQMRHMMKDMRDATQWSEQVYSLSRDVHSLNHDLKVHKRAYETLETRLMETETLLERREEELLTLRAETDATKQQQSAQVAQLRRWLDESQLQLQQTQSETQHAEAENRVLVDRLAEAEERLRRVAPTPGAHTPPPDSLVSSVVGGWFRGISQARRNNSNEAPATHTPNAALSGRRTFHSGEVSHQAQPSSRQSSSDAPHFLTPPRAAGGAASAGERSRPGMLSAPESSSSSAQVEAMKLKAATILRRKDNEMKKMREELEEMKRVRDDMDEMVRKLSSEVQQLTRRPSLDGSAETAAAGAALHIPSPGQQGSALLGHASDAETGGTPGTAGGTRPPRDARKKDPLMVKAAQAIKKKDLELKQMRDELDEMKRVRDKLDAMVRQSSLHLLQQATHDGMAAGAVAGAAAPDAGSTSSAPAAEAQLEEATRALAASREREAALLAELSAVRAQVSVHGAALWAVPPEPTAQHPGDAEHKQALQDEAAASAAALATVIAAAEEAATASAAREAVLTQQVATMSSAAEVAAAAATTREAALTKQVANVVAAAEQAATAQSAREAELKQQVAALQTECEALRQELKHCSEQLTNARDKEAQLDAAASRQAAAQASAVQAASAAQAELVSELRVTRQQLEARTAQLQAAQQREVQLTARQRRLEAAQQQLNSTKAELAAAQLREVQSVDLRLSPKGRAIEVAQREAEAVHIKLAEAVQREAEALAARDELDVKLTALQRTSNAANEAHAAEMQAAQQQHLAVQAELFAVQDELLAVRRDLQARQAELLAAQCAAEDASVAHGRQLAAVQGELRAVHEELEAAQQSLQAVLEQQLISAHQGDEAAAAVAEREAAVKLVLAERDAKVEEAQQATVAQAQLQLRLTALEVELAALSHQASCQQANNAVGVPPAQALATAARVSVSGSVGGNGCGSDQSAECETLLECQGRCRSLTQELGMVRVKLSALLDAVDVAAKDQLDKLAWQPGDDAGTSGRDGRTDSADGGCSRWRDTSSLYALLSVSEQTRLLHGEAGQQQRQASLANIRMLQAQLEHVLCHALAEGHHAGGTDEAVLQDQAWCEGGMSHDPGSGSPGRATGAHALPFEDPAFQFTRQYNQAATALASALSDPSASESGTCGSGGGAFDDGFVHLPAYGGTGGTINDSSSHHGMHGNNNDCSISNNKNNSARACSSSSPGGSAASTSLGDDLMYQGGAWWDLPPPEAPPVFAPIGISP